MATTCSGLRISRVTSDSGSQPAGRRRATDRTLTVGERNVAAAAWTGS